MRLLWGRIMMLDLSKKLWQVILVLPWSQDQNIVLLLCFGNSSQDSHSWQNKVVMVEDDWIPVLGKISKQSPPHFDMTPRSQKKGGKGKTQFLLLYCKLWVLLTKPSQIVWAQCLFYLVSLSFWSWIVSSLMVFHQSDLGCQTCIAILWQHFSKLRSQKIHCLLLIEL